MKKVDMPQSISAVAAAALGVQVIAAILWLLVAATVRMPSEMGLGLMSVSPKQTAKSWAGIFRYVPAKIWLWHIGLFSVASLMS